MFGWGLLASRVLLIEGCIQISAEKITEMSGPNFKAKLLFLGLDILSIYNLEQ